jgi:hypothetical protein
MKNDIAGTSKNKDEEITREQGKESEMKHGREIFFRISIN